jgi:glycosyltransferase involved in cell wall biosynthesis
LFPIEWEEPFGLVMVESMATGTPVIAYARGATKEIIKDGETGFLVNPSDIDIRGNFIIKKTGQAGIQEAVERIYSMPDNEYARIRQNCRRHVENLFTIEKMVNQYIDFFKTL